MVNQFQIAVNQYVLTRTHRHLIPFYLFARPFDAQFSADLKQLCDSLTLPPATFFKGGGGGYKDNNLYKQIREQFNT